MDERVKVVRPSLLKAWRNSGSQELWFEFRPVSPAETILASVMDATDAANTVTETAGLAELVFGSDAAESPDGVAVHLEAIDDEQALFAWLDAFAQALQGVGLTGRVTAAPKRSFPRWLGGANPLPYQLMALVSYRTVDLTGLTQDERQRGWHVDQDLTERIASLAVDWGRFEGATTYLMSGVFKTTTGQDVAGPLARSLHLQGGLGSLTYLQEGPPIKIMASTFVGLGRTGYQVWDDALSWRQRLDRLLNVLTSLPEHTDLALVQYAHPLALSWSNITHGRPPIAHIHEYQIRYNRHLDSSYVPDARGVQVLTDAHLAHAHDLSEWHVEPLGGGRHLVQAKDLAAWYAQPDPAPEVLSRARADFGDMILTTQTLEALGQQ